LIIKEIIGATSVPPGISNSIETYRVKFSLVNGWTVYVNQENNEPITFDFSSDYREQLLVHEQCGEGVFFIEK